ncbi:hypothetical protein F4604DRAFT_1686201 [Suillus subluteus]|nr:hypothetical protein F4604DRAFT_1686201 [Suillus subluteus]
MYSEVLKVFASFVDSTIKHEDSLPATNCNHNRDVEASEGLDTKADEDCTGKKLNLFSSMDEFSQASKPLDYNIDYNGLQLADYKAVMLSLLEMPSMDSEGASSHLPFLPPVEREPDTMLHGSQPPVAIKALTHTQMPTPPAPPASQKAAASEPCAHHVEDEQPSAQHTAVWSRNAAMGYTCSSPANTATQQEGKGTLKVVRYRKAHYPTSKGSERKGKVLQEAHKVPTHFLMARAAELGNWGLMHYLEC